MQGSIRASGTRTMLVWLSTHERSLSHTQPTWQRAYVAVPAHLLVAVFEEEEDPSSKSFFSEIISSISDVRFSNDGMG